MNETLVVGLGNPGRRYVRTRHNVGFRCLDRFAGRQHLRFDHRYCDALVALGHVEGEPVVLAKPQTYMNASGRAVRGLLGRSKLSPERLIVVYDDLDLPVGRIRLREAGSAGGHRGVQSIVDALVTNEFRRIRLGIGRPLAEDPIEYVLRPFEQDDESVINHACDAAADAIYCALTEGFTTAMNKFNRDVT